MSCPFLDFLASQRWLESAWTLERESGVTPRPYCKLGPRAQFVRELILDGLWAEVLTATGIDTTISTLKEHWINEKFMAC